MGEYIYAIRKTDKAINVDGETRTLGLLKYWYKPYYNPFWEPESFRKQIAMQTGKLEKIWEAGSPDFAILVGPDGKVKDGQRVYKVPTGLTYASDYSPWFELSGIVGVVRIVGKTLQLDRKTLGEVQLLESKDLELIMGRV